MLPGHRLLLPALLLGIAAAAANSSAKLCNERSRFECDCSTCWQSFAGKHEIEWLSVRLDQCSSTEPAKLVPKLVAWINEECSSFISCPQLRLPVAPEQVVLGEWRCAHKKDELKVVLLKTPNAKISAESVVSPAILGQILRSRQHLLSFVTHAELLAVEVHLPTETTTTTTTTMTTSELPGRTRAPPRATITAGGAPDPALTPLFHVFLPWFLVSLMVLCCVTVCMLFCVHNVRHWSRVAKGRWRRKPYRKVHEETMSTQSTV